MLAQKYALFLRRCMLVVFFLLCVLALYSAVGQDPWQLALGISGALLLWRLYPHIPVERLGTKRLWLILTLGCLLIKGIWIFRARVPIAGDYSVFWGYAKQFASDGPVYGGRYMALFPHIYGFASFLSPFVRLFGANELLAPILNLLLTLLSGSILFLIFRDDLRRASMAYLLWILCPSQTMYNALVLSEPLYTTLLLLFLLGVVELDRRGAKLPKPLLVGAGAGALGGLLLRWINMCRPVAAIPIIALVIWLVLLSGRFTTGASTHTHTNAGFAGPAAGCLPVGGIHSDRSGCKRHGSPGRGRRAGVTARV